jgi:hypothetical protein
MPASTRRCPYRIAVYCEPDRYDEQTPRKERLPRTYGTISDASNAGSARNKSNTCQPTIAQENTSVTDAA